IESAVIFRKVARIACLVLLAGLLPAGVAVAQLPIKAPAQVSVGSIIPFSHGSTGAWAQIYSMKVDPKYGNILFLDSAVSELFQLAPGATTPILIGKPAPSTGNSDCSDLEKSGSYWNAAVAFDAWDNLYITDRYGSAVQFCRIPYNASAGTWTFSNADNWAGPTYKNSSGAATSIPPQDLQSSDDGVTFFVSTSDTQSIYKYVVNESGTVTSVTPIMTGMEDMTSNLAIDHAGNLFFLENAYDSLSAKVVGIREITVAQMAANPNGFVGDGTGKTESTFTRIDQGGFNGIKGMSFDAQGNMYFTSANNSSYGGDVDGTFMIPNEGTPTNPNLVWADTVMVSPVPGGFPPLVDPRGFLWIATGGSSNWAPPGVNAPNCDTTTNQTAAATCTASTIVQWKPGALTLGASAAAGANSTTITGYSVAAAGGTLTLTAPNAFSENQVVTITAGSSDALFPLNGLSFYVSGTGLSSTAFQISTSLIAAGASGSSSAKAVVSQAQALYYMFNQPATVGKFALAQPSGSHFLRVANTATPNTTATAPVLPCTDGASYPAFSPNETTTTQYSWCPYYVQLNTTMAGSAEGELQALDSSNNVLSGSNAYIGGVGQAASVSVVSSASVQSIASGLNDPRQVAADPSGNTYVADSALKAIETFPAGTTSPTSGKVFGTSLSAPSGVAVDGVGNLYIGDSGKVIEIPFINGALATAQQTTVATGLGTGNLSLAADAAGDIFVADQQKAQVVEIPNPQTALILEGQPLAVLGADAGFKGPTAIATDSSGNIWVADGSNLWEITLPFGAANEVITNQLQAPVTGLAVDPSGSVYVAGAMGVVWIPFNSATGSLNINGQVLVASGLGSGSSPTLAFGLALDGSQNLYATYGSGSTAGLAQLGIGGSIDFSNYGEINPNVPFEVDAQILNVGNEPLTLAAYTGDSLTGAGAANYTVATATENSPACGPTTNTPPGGSCYLGLVLQAPSAGQTSASVAVLSNAGNAASGVNIALSGNVVQDLRPATSLTISITPSTSGTGCAGSIYPGCENLTVTVSSSAGTPSGSVSLSVGSANGNLPKQTQTLDSNGTAQFTYSGLLGGTYNANANYDGNGTAGATQNTCSPASALCFAGSASKTSFTVTPAAPAFVVGIPVTNAQCLNSTTFTNGSASLTCVPNPDFVTTWAGSTYVHVAQPVFISTTVTSTVGTPTGTVTFMQNGKPVDPSQGVNGAISLNGNGVTTFSTQNLAEGLYNLTAVYSGDVNYAPKTFTLPAFQVITESVQITAPSGTTNITGGTPVQVTLTLEPLVGFSGNVSLECNAANSPVPIPATTPPTALPPYTECTFQYADTVTGTSPVGKSGPTASTILITLSTNVPVNGNTGATGSLARQAPWSLAGIFGLGLLGLIAGRKRVNRYLTMICLAAMLSGVFMSLTSCTNAGYSTPPPTPKVTTPPGTYNVQIITYDPQGLTQNSLTTPVFTLPVTVQ
ncbi:MAG: Ig-like domain repeat protein, partial [Terracidiphilus sp.]